MWSMSGGDGSWIGRRGLVRGPARRSHAPFCLDEMEILVVAHRRLDAHQTHERTCFASVSWSITVIDQLTDAKTFFPYSWALQSLKLS